jgi:Ca2+-binding RTX toxin-like protein
VDVTFKYNANPLHVKISYDNTPAQWGWDGVTHEWFFPNGQTSYADIHIVPKAQSQSYLFLHEMGHVLGISQPENTQTPVTTTLMAWASYVNDNYTVAQMNKITQYTHGDIVDLWGLYGVSAQYKGDVIGDARNNTLYGGRGIVDPLDNSETVKGMGGSDTLYGNGGDDTIFGGNGLIDPNDMGDLIFGGAGNDVIYGNGGNDTIYGGAGVDTIYGGVGADVIYYDKYDILYGTDDTDTLFLIA